MIGILRSDRLSALLSARLTDAADDEVAGVIMGPRLRDLCAALGVPVRDWWQVSRWLDHHENRHCRSDALGAYIDVMVADRCGRPGNDLLSDLITFEVDGCGLTADEIRAIVIKLISPPISRH